MTIRSITLLLLLLGLHAQQTSAFAFGSRLRSTVKSSSSSSNIGVDADEHSEHVAIGEKETKPKRKSRKARIKSDERVVFFPTAAHRGEDNESWEVPIHGWIYEPEFRDPARRAMVTAIRKSIKLKRHSEETEIFKRRIRSFLVDNERRKRLSIQLGCGPKESDESRIFPLEASAKNGHFEDVLCVSDAELDRLCEDKCDGDCRVLRFRAVVEDGDDRVFEGMAHLVPATGVSVISDIDDTVKITGVGKTKELLKSTFMREFQAVPGMADIYQKWHDEYRANFHFVSSSPWQLWEEMSGFLRDGGFPDATFHLKPIRIKDKSLFNLWKDPLQAKIRVIESIVKEFPRREYVLVGDTGEKDPEVYGEIARRYPDKVKGIYLRKNPTPDDDGTEERYQEAFSGVDSSIVHLFDDATAMPWQFKPVDQAVEEKEL